MTTGNDAIFRAKVDSESVEVMNERLERGERNWRGMDQAAKGADAQIDKAGDNLKAAGRDAEKAGDKGAKAGKKIAVSWADIGGAVTAAKGGLDLALAAMQQIAEASKAGAESIMVAEAFERLGGTADDMERFKAATAGFINETQIQQLHNLAGTYDNIASTDLDPLITRMVDVAAATGKTANVMAELEQGLVGIEKGEAGGFERLGFTMAEVEDRARELNAEFDTLSASGKLAEKRAAALSLTLETDLGSASDSAAASILQTDAEMQNMISDVEVLTAELLESSGVLDKFQEGLESTRAGMQENSGSIRLVSNLLESATDVWWLLLPPIAAAVKAFEGVVWILDQVSTGLDNFNSKVVAQLEGVAAANQDAAESFDDTWAAQNRRNQAIAVENQKEKEKLIASREALQSAEQDAFAAHLAEQEKQALASQNSIKKAIGASSDASGGLVLFGPGGLLFDTDTPAVDPELLAASITDAFDRAQENIKAAQADKEEQGSLLAAMIIGGGEDALELLAEQIGEGLNVVSEVVERHRREAEAWKNTWKGALVDVAGVGADTASELVEAFSAIGDAQGDSNSAMGAGFALAGAGLKAARDVFLSTEGEKAAFSSIAEFAMAASAVATGLIPGNQIDLARAAQHVIAGTSWAIAAAKAGKGSGSSAGASAGGAGASAGAAGGGGTSPAERAQELLQNQAQQRGFFGGTNESDAPSSVTMHIHGGVMDSRSVRDLMLDAANDGPLGGGRWTGQVFPNRILPTGPFQAGRI